MPLLCTFNSTSPENDAGTQISVALAKVTGGKDCTLVTIESESLTDVAILGSRIRSAHPYAIHLDPHCREQEGKKRYSLSHAWNYGVPAESIADALEAINVLEPTQSADLKAKIQAWRNDPK